MFINRKTEPSSLPGMFFIGLSTLIIPETILAFDNQHHINNEYAEVREITLQPGEILKEDRALHRLIYPLNNYSITHKRNDEAIEKSRKTRSTLYSIPKNITTIKNSGNSGSRFLEIKSRITPKMTNIPGPSLYELTQQKHISEYIPYLTKTIFENTHFRATEYIMPPYTYFPSHSISNHVMVSIGRTNIYYKNRKGYLTNHSLDVLDSTWNEAGKYSMNNNTNRISHFLIIEIKPPERYSNYSP